MSTDALNAPASRRNRFLLMRHAHSQANAEGRIISTPPRGIEAFGLSSRGHAQLDEVLGDWRWPVPTRVLHSDFLRTTQTAERVGEHFRLPLTPETCLRERRFGDFDGGPDDRYPQVWALDARDPHHREHAVESVASVAERMIAVIAMLEREYHGETILLVSHGDPLQILLTALERRPLSQHRDRDPLEPAGVVPLT